MSASMCDYDDCYRIPFWCCLAPKLYHPLYNSAVSALTVVCFLYIMRVLQENMREGSSSGSPFTVIGVLMNCFHIRLLAHMQMCCTAVQNYVLLCFIVACCSACA